MTVRASSALIVPLLLGWAAATASALALGPLLAGLDSPVDVHRLIWLATAIAPLTQFGKALAFASVLWAVLVLLGREVDLLPLWSVLLFGEALVALDGVLLAGWMQATPSAAWVGPEGLASPLALGTHLELARSGWGRILQSFDLLHLGWATWVFVGLHRRLDLPSTVAIGLVLMILTLRLAVSAAPGLVSAA